MVRRPLIASATARLILSALRETKDEKDAKKAKKKSPVAKDAKPPLRDATNEREKMNAAA